MGRDGIKAQSAMEYLATYSWAILIITVVAAALFALGIFNGILQPRAFAGSCQVSRPNGPGTISFINKEGTCIGELPKFVSHFGYVGMLQQFGLSNLSVNSVKYQPLITSSNNHKITITGWLYPNLQGPQQTAYFYGDPSGTGGNWPFNAIYINTNQSPYCNGGVFVALYTSMACIYSANTPINKWMFTAIEYDGIGNVVGYMIVSDNVIVGKGAVNPFLIPAHSTLLISTPWNGLVSNIQMYNTSLTQNQIYAVYRTGIGGAPIDMQYLVGWWPLNGDTKDYSGNGNDALATNSAFYSSGWLSNYGNP